MNDVPRYPKPEALLQIPKYGHAVIEASAGTGKTYTIEHWILDLLVAGTVSIKEILVLTFTVKGAAELRSRLRARIRHLLTLETTSSLLPPEQCFCLDVQARGRLMSALTDFDQAPIHTIHGFCNALIGEYAFAFGRPFETLERNVVEERALFGRAFRELLRSELATGEDSEPILYAWLQTKGSRVGELEALLFECHRVAEGLKPAFDAEGLRAAVQSLPDLEGIETRLETLVPKVSLAKVRKTLGALRAALDEPTSFSMLGRLESIELSYLADKLDALREPLGALRAAAVSLSAVVVQAFLPRVRERLRAMKRESGEVDYQDMLTLVAEALGSEHSESLKRDLRSRYRVALVDEFQDTDRVQWQILRSFFFEGGGGNPLCIVGDPKQAIYGFRGADVHAYLDAKRAIVTRSVVIPLVDCFRSTPELIHVLNRVFDQKLVTPFFTGNVRYDRPVRPGNPELSLTGGGSELVKPLVLLRPSWDSARHTQKDTKKALLHGIAREIRALAERPLRFGERGRERSVELSDIFVLTRTNDEASDVGGARDPLRALQAGGALLDARGRARRRPSSRARGPERSLPTLSGVDDALFRTVAARSRALLGRSRRASVDEPTFRMARPRGVEGLREPRTSNPGRERPHPTPAHPRKRGAPLDQLSTSLRDRVAGGLSGTR